MEFEIVNEQLPVIQINFEDLKNGLTQTMEKYKGYIVTEDNLALCKSTKNELLHIRTDIDNYRKNKKKALSEPIVNFENQCKLLIDLVEKAEKPIREGIQVFDDKKRESKKQLALKLIQEATEAQSLTAKYSIQLTVLDKYTLLGAKDKEVAEYINIRAEDLKRQQITELDMLEIIKDTIENANKNINAKLSIADFQRLINAKTPTKEIISEINSRAERIKKSETEAEELRIKRELAKVEADRIANLPKEVEQEPTVEQMEAFKSVNDAVLNAVKEVATSEPLQRFTTENHFNESVPEPLYFVELRVTGNLTRIKELSILLKANKFGDYITIKKGLVD
jgi:hypothetical protein